MNNEKMKKIIIATLVLVAFAALTVIFIIKKDNANPPVSPSTIINDPEQISEPNPAVDPFKEMADSNPNLLYDKDGDGIVGYLERDTYATDANNLDTDSDGLNDGEEILIYNANPNNPDTDGDSYKDGEEVQNGYNPNGPGKLVK